MDYTWIRGIYLVLVLVNDGPDQVEEEDAYFRIRNRIYLWPATPYTYTLPRRLPPQYGGG